MISFVRRYHGQFCHYMLILQDVTSDRLSTISSAEDFLIPDQDIACFKFRP